MQIVIEIPNGCYEELNNGQFPVQDAYRLVAWIKDGTPLPKGHGDLIDRSEISIPYDICDGDEAMGYVNEVSAIIETDKRESEEQEMTEEYMTEKQKKLILEMREFSNYPLSPIDLKTATKKEASEWISKNQQAFERTDKFGFY